jgi:hypothetical protein
MVVCYRWKSSLLSLCLLLVSCYTYAQELYPVSLPDSLWHHEERTLRYHPEGNDFVIVNGNRRFTRALYGTNTAFRVEAGDLPEFALYMPGMGGNFKFGIAADGKDKWLIEAKKITARYRPGSMLYEIEDPLLGEGKLMITILPLADSEGFVIKATAAGLKKPITLYWAFGGANGKKFSRDGDMGPDPESNFYLKPENCKGNNYNIARQTFTVAYGTPSRLLTGICPPQGQLKIADATGLSSPVNLYHTDKGNFPLLTGKLDLVNATPCYFKLYRPTDSIPDIKMAEAFSSAEAARQQLVARIKIKTPDPYLNTIGGALAVAADAIWEAPSYLHGAVGWRVRLNGWRGPYVADPTGWHDRAETHLKAYAQSQVKSPATGAVIADTAMHLARSKEQLGVGMFTAGYISREPEGKPLRAHHYDMNLVYIDQLLRHFMWTGNRSFMKESWPLLQLHLAWEKRNFDADDDGLYDAYAAIWASDALQYSGGGVAHTSAYNYWANKQAAVIAAMIGEDPAPYVREAAKIKAAMNKLLWLPEKGTYGEYKDALGNRLVHPAAALWTIYHSLDAEVPDAFQAWESVRYIDREIPHIPVRATGLTNEGYYTLATSRWMPYTWSLNNVALAESMHTALANWQAGRNDEAFKLFKSEILAAMYLGGSPGNFVQISHYDAIRGEAYRDFGDPVGMFSRTLVEGLFGIVPNALIDTLTIRPGLPVTWEHASLAIPDISFDFKRKGKTDSYVIVPAFQQPLALKWQLVARGQVQEVLLNGKPVNWKNKMTAVGKPVIEINAAAANKYALRITWKDAKPVMPSSGKVYYSGEPLSIAFPGTDLLKVYDPQTVLDNVQIAAGKLSARVTGPVGERTVFLLVQQGELRWWMPVCFNVKNEVEMLSANSNTFLLHNHLPVSVKAVITVNGFETTLDIPGGKNSAAITVPEEQLLPGTNPVIIRLPDGKVIKSILTDWSPVLHQAIATIDLSAYFNDKVTNIFRNKYLSPRPQTTTLQLPWQGIGDWPHVDATADIDDSGWRTAAGRHNQITLPQGIPFRTPGDQDSKNIVFTTQWDNYADSVVIPVDGKATHAWFLMAGSTNPMQSQLDNGVISVTYTDGTRDTLALRNPETWWPIEKDYYVDGFAFALNKPRPVRVHLKTGQIVDAAQYNGKEIPGGAATVLDLPLNGDKTLASICLKTIANDVVIGLMSVTLLR